jgi:hypothetical protein
MREDKRVWPEIFWYLGGLIPLIIVASMWTATESQPVPQRVLLTTLGMILGGLGGYALSEFLHPFAPANAQVPSGYVIAQIVPNTQGPVIDQSVKSYNQQGGITAHSVTIAPPSRNLDAPENQTLKQQMLSQLPKDKEISVTAILGDAESIDFALQINGFLKANGFKVKDGISQAVFTGAVHGLSFNPETNNFVVGAR